MSAQLKHTKQDDLRAAFEKIASPSERIDDRAFALFVAGAYWAREVYEPMPPTYRVQPAPEGVEPLKLANCTFA